MVTMVCGIVCNIYACMISTCSTVGACWWVAPVVAVVDVMVPGVHHLKCRGVHKILR
jgi:hypothetical protein